MNILKTQNEIRRKNLEALVEQAGGQTKLADKCGLNQTYISQILANRRPLGERSARNLEKRLGLPVFSLDKSNDVVLPHDLKIPRYDVEASMGYGKFVLQENVIENLTVSPEWLSRHLKNRINTKGLCIITGSGVSMEPIFSDGDPLIIDTTINVFVGEAIYYFRVNDALYVKWLQQTPAGFKAIPNNKETFDPFLISKNDELQIIGKVIKAWKGTDF